MSTRRLVHALVILMLALSATRALAQAPQAQQPLVDPFAATPTRVRETPDDLVPWETRELSARDRQLARELFQQGVAATQASDWVTAQDAFGRVYALTHRAEVLLNLATAQAQTGALLSAVESYRRFLQTASPELQTQHGEEARAALARVEARLPRLRVDGTIAAEHTVVLDGTALSRAELGVALPLDPGTHEVRLEGAEGVLDAETVTLGESESRAVTLSAPEAPSVVDEHEEALVVETAPVFTQTHDDGPDVGLIGLGVSLGVVVVAGVVVAIIFATQPSEDPGYTGSLGRITSDANQPYMGTLASWDAL